jgi:hypothetical protein
MADNPAIFVLPPRPPPFKYGGRVDKFVGTAQHRARTAEYERIKADYLQQYRRYLNALRQQGRP